MSFLSKFAIDGQEFNVIEFRIAFHQESDNTGKPLGIPKGGTIFLTIESDQKTDFLSWMLDSDTVKDGKVTFYRRDAMSKMRELVFKKAYCVSYEESFSASTENPMQIKLSLTAKELTFGDAKFGNNWIIS